MPHPSDPKTLEQIRKALLEIDNSLLDKDFKLWGFEFYSLEVNKKRKLVPKTVWVAYQEMKEAQENPKVNLNPVQILATYYAHFRVAIRPEHDQPTRDKDTREFYEALARKKGQDIFPDNKEAADQFDREMAKMEADIAQKREPEQKEYLAFQATLKTEKENIQALEKNCKELNRLISSYFLNNIDTSKQAIKFLYTIINRMKLTSSRSDLDAYTEDASIVLDCILPYMQTAGLKKERAQQLEMQITKLKDSINTFAHHHNKLMMSLTDKKNASYIRSALETAAAVLSMSVVLGMLPSWLGTGINAGSKYLKTIEDKTKSQEVLPNVYAPTRKLNLREEYIHQAAKIRKHLKDHLKNPKMLLIAVLVGLASLTPSLQIHVGIAKGVYKLGKVAAHTYSKNSLFNTAEKKTINAKTTHEEKMQKYLGASPKHDKYQSRIETWEKNNIAKLARAR